MCGNLYWGDSAGGVGVKRRGSVEEWEEGWVELQKAPWLRQQF